MTGPGKDTRGTGQVAARGLHLPVEGRIGHEDARGRIRQEDAQLVPPELGAERDGERAELERREHGQTEWGPVREEGRDAVARPDAEPRETGGEPPDAVLELPPGQAAGGVDDGRAVGRPLDGAGEQDGQAGGAVGVAEHVPPEPPLATDPRGQRRRPGVETASSQARRTCVFTKAMMSRVDVPGVKISRTPSALSRAMSSGGTMPPPKTTTSSAPFSRRSSSTRPKR